METYSLAPIGYIRSEIKNRKHAPLFYDQGAPDAWLDLLPEYEPGLTEMKEGAEIVVLTWLHEARREVLEVYPRGDRSRPLTGVFSTRSSDRPNPIGLHRATVRSIDGTRLRIGPIEAIDGTPVVDIKRVVEYQDY